MKKRQINYLILTLLIGILFLEPLHAQTSFGGRLTLSTAVLNPTDVFSADLDGDGDKDVLSSSLGDDKIAWYENLGAGNFSGPQKIISSAINNAYSVYACDLDNDSDIDVLASSFSDNKIYWFANNGSGVFGSPTVISATANGPSDIRCADLDSDGDFDVVSSNFVGNSIVWHENLGSGSFGAAQIISTLVNKPESVFTADINGDGIIDVLSASKNDDKIAWYMNDGTGTFATQSVITTAVDGAKEVFAADLDGDMDLDVVCAGFNDNQISWFANNGSGVFGGEININSSATGAECVYATDLDFDGDIDIISGQRSANTVSWYQNLGGGSFASASNLSSGATGPFSVIADDLNSDGDPDVIVAARDGSGIYWWKNSGAKQFESQTIISTSGSGATDVFSADLDADGDIDIVSSSYYDSEITFHENIGGGLFASPVVLTTVFANPYSVFCSDFDSDGDLDVLTGGYGDSEIGFIENIGGGLFGGVQIVTNLSANPYDVEAYDLDNDGDDDILVASFGDDDVAWYENVGGVFGGKQIIESSLSNPYAVHAVDLDGDNDLEVLIANYGNSRVQMYENIGGGLFGSSQIISTSFSNPSDVNAADIDGDGDKDVIACGYSDYRVGWIENIGGGLFASTTTISSGSSSFRPRRVYPMDYDGDGDQDIACASYSDNEISWYENLAAGIFDVQEVVTNSASGAFSVFPGDLDGDGDQDLISASWNDNKIAWYENRLPGLTAPCLATVVINPADTTICTGSSVTLSLAVGYGSGIISWSTGASTPSITVSPTTNTTYTVSVAGTGSYCLDTATVNILPASPPVISCPADITVSTGSSGGIIASYSAPTATDDCSTPVISQIAGLASGSNFPIGLSVNTFVATDAEGNSDTCSFTVTVDLIATSCSLLDTFNTVYPTPLDDGTNNIIEVSSGGYLIVGATDNYGTAGGKDMFLKRFDCLGAELWTQTIGTSFDDKANGVVEVADGFLVVGNLGTSATITDVGIVKTDFAGIEMWRKTYGGVSNDIANNIAAIGDGTYVVAGSSEQGGSEDGYLLKIDSAGDTLWTRFYDESLNERFNTVIPTASGEIFLAGRRNNFIAGSEKGMIIKTDANGNKLFRKIAGDSISFYYAALTLDDGVICVGRKRLSGNKFMLYAKRYSSSGNSEWERTYTDGGRDWGGSVVAESDGNFLIAGINSDASVTNVHGWLVRLASNGNLIEERLVKKSNKDLFRDVIIDSKGNIVAAGETDGYFGAPGNAWVARLLPNLTPCEIPGFNPFPTGQTFCNGDVLDAGSGYDNYAWSTGDTTSQIVVPFSGTISVTVSDISGCSSTDSLVATILAPSPPTITCPADITISSSSPTSVFYTLPNATDDCSLPTVNLLSGLGSGSTFPLGTTSVTYQAMDDDGLTANCSFAVTVTAPCTAPTGKMSTTDVNAVFLQWNHAPNYQSYGLRGHKIGSGFGTASSTNNYKVIAGLQSGATYEWQVRTICTDGSISPYTSLMPFTTMSPRNGDFAISNVNMRPNPAQDFVELNWAGESSLEVSIIDVTGRVRKSVSDVTGDIQISIDDIEAGIYYVMLSNDSAKELRKLVVIR